MTVPTRRVRFPAEASAAAWFFVAPALALIGVFFFVPVAASLLLSVTDFDIYAVASTENTRFVGLDNYARLLRTPLFWSSLQNTFYFALVGGPLGDDRRAKRRSGKVAAGGPGAVGKPGRRQQR